MVHEGPIRSDSVADPVGRLPEEGANPAPSPRLADLPDEAMEGVLRLAAVVGREFRVAFWKQPAGSTLRGCSTCSTRLPTPG